MPQKLPKSKKGFQNRVVTTFNAKLTQLGLFWDQIWTLVPFGTKSQIWDFIRRPAYDFPNPPPYPQHHAVVAESPSVWPIRRPGCIFNRFPVVEVFKHSFLLSVSVCQPHLLLVFKTQTEIKLSLHILTISTTIIIITTITIVTLHITAIIIVFATHIWNQVNPLSTSSPESFSRNLLRFLHMMREPGVPWEVFSSGKPKYFTSPTGTLWLSQTSSCQNTSQPWVRCIWWKKMKLITKTASGNLSRELGTQVESFGLQLEKGC